MSIDLLWKLAPIAAGVVGYAGGILSEPIKAWLKRRFDANVLRRALYAELFRNLDVIEGVCVKLTEDRDYLSGFNPYKEFMTFECYEYAKKSQPITFNQLPEATTLNALFAVLYTFVNVDREPEHLRALSEDVHERIVGLILRRSLDPFLLHAVDPKRTSALPLNKRVWLNLRSWLRRPFRREPPILLGSLSPRQRRSRPLDMFVEAKEKLLAETSAKAAGARVNSDESSPQG